MQKHPKGMILVYVALAVALSGIAGTGFGEEAGRQGEELDAGVVLGEEDLSERAEIARNMFRRITPGNDPFVQDAGTWPALWEAFGANWNAAAAGREYGAWVVPVSVSQENGATVIRDANNLELWRGTTDFAKEESASVTLTGGLVAEEEWDGYEGVRDFANVWQNQGIFAKHWQNGMVGRAVPTGSASRRWTWIRTGRWMSRLRGRRPGMSMSSPI
ncbi:MAG: hypothetical protein IJS32_04065 [Kiritimatiellae bacterium]|nr:hypothetical protein [Kiritimatiellia bacterium]